MSIAKATTPMFLMGGWLVGSWDAGWLLAWLAGWLAIWLAGWLGGWLVGCQLARWLAAS